MNAMKFWLLLIIENSLELFNSKETRNEFNLRLNGTDIES